MVLNLTEEQIAIRDTFGRFTDEQIIPKAEAIDEAHEYGVYPLPEQPPEGADVGDDLPELQR